MESTTPFVVTEALSKIYYKGLPSQPRLVATTRPGPFDPPPGPEAYTIPKQLRVLGDHSLAEHWDNGLAQELRDGLNDMGVNWTSLEALRIVDAGQSSELAIVWIGIEFGALSFEEGSKVALNCRRLIDSYGIHDYHVEIRESRVMRQAGNRFLDGVPPTDPTFTARNPFTATHGIPISAKDLDGPWVEGTGGFYLSAGGNDKNIYLVTARHVVLPLDKDNKEYERKNESQGREEVVVLGNSGFTKKLIAIDKGIDIQKSNIDNAKTRIRFYEGKEDRVLVRAHKKAKSDLEEAEEGVEELTVFRSEIATFWEAKENRVMGELTWAPPINLSTEPGQYTLDLAVIKIDPGMLDAKNYRGNAINIGNKYTHLEFMNQVYLDPTNPTSFKFPVDCIVELQGQVPKSELIKPSMLDSAGESCLIVFKNGFTTDTTIGEANNISSYTRTYFTSEFKGEFKESREWPVIPTEKHLGAFSAKGDSGSCVVDAFNRIGGILTGGSGATDSSDVTYVTPISFIMEFLHGTKRFQHAHLNPVLA
jgi:hypothetical protein